MPYTAAQLTAYYTSLTGVAPDGSTSLLFQAYSNQNNGGTLSDAQTLAAVFNSVGVQATFEVAESTYQFFTGSTTSAAGLAYLEGLAGSGNTNGLTNTYYNGTGGSITSPGTGGFNVENRYYNFAINLASAGGAGNASFAATYGGLTFAQTVSAAYENIVGSANVGTANANAAIADIISRQGFFQQIASTRGGDATANSSPNTSLTLKAVVVGYILEEANKADVGTYAKAIDQFEASVANGNAIFATNALQTYQAGGAGFNTGVGNSNSTGTLGQTIAFTPGTDTFNTTAANTTFIAQVGGTAAGVGGTSATLGPSDTVNAQGANNTLITNVVTTAPAVPVPAGGLDASGGAILNGIQTIDVRSADGTAAQLNQSAVPNATALNSYLSIGQVTFNNVAGSTTVGIVGNGTVQGGSLVAAYASGATSNVALTGGVLSSVVAGGGAATNVAVTSAAAGSTLNLTSSGQANSVDNFALTGYSTVNITANQAFTANATTDATLATLNVSGGTAVDLGGTVLSNTVRTVTSTNTGGLRASFDTSGTSLSVTTSATAADRITLNAATATTTVNTGGGGDIIAVTGAITAGASLNGSGGATLQVTNAGYGNIAGFTAANRALITGFSTLAVTDTTGLTSGTTYDVNLIGAQNFTSGGVATGGAATVNAASGAIVTFLGGANGVSANNGALTINEANATTNTNDTLTLGFTGQTANAGTTAAPIAITANQIEQVQVVANRSAATVAAGTQPVLNLSIQDTQAQAITFAGNERVAFNTGAGAGFGASTFAQLTSVTAVNATANETINVASINTSTAAIPFTLTGGAGADTLTFHDFARVTGGAGSDLFVATQTTNGNSYSSIVDATAGDSVGFAANTVTGAPGQPAIGAQAAVTGANATKVTLAATAGYQDFLDAAIAQSTAGQVRAFDFGGNTYLVDHNSAAATFQNGTDSVVQLVGIHTISSTLTAAGNVAITG